MTNETGLPPEAEHSPAGECGRAVQNDMASPSPDSGIPAYNFDLHLAAENAAKCVAAFDENMTPAAMREALERMMLADSEGEAALLLQAQVLGAMFHRLAQKALTAPRWHMGEGGNYIDDKGIDLALRSQQLCRANYDSLCRIRQQKIKNTDEKKDG